MNPPSVRDALALMLETGDDVLAVHSGDQSLGVLTLASIRERSVSERPRAGTNDPIEGADLDRAHAKASETR